jgi:hypothetical protein
VKKAIIHFFNHIQRLMYMLCFKNKSFNFLIAFAFKVPTDGAYNFGSGGAFEWRDGIIEVADGDAFGAKQVYVRKDGIFEAMENEVGGVEYAYGYLFFALVAEYACVVIKLRFIVHIASSDRRH